MKTFELVKGLSRPFATEGIKCLICGRTSWNKNDVEQRYCGNCHQFHDVMGEQDEQGRDLPRSTS